MIELNKIYNEDCLDTMARMSDKFVDLTITSPPYNLGDKHHTKNKWHKPYDDDMPEELYQEWQIQVLVELFRITNDGGNLIYNHKNRIKDGVSISPYEWLLKTDWVIKQELVWFNGSPNFDKIRFYPMTERVYWLAKSSKTKLFNAINHHDFFDVKDWKPMGTNIKHTRCFPVKMVKDFLKCFKDVNILYDPFMGSGTVAEGALWHGTNYIGSEISKEYCNMAEKRLDDTRNKLRFRL